MPPDSVRNASESNSNNTSSPRPKFGERNRAVSTTRPILVLQATVAAGPRKELDADRQLGEDVACIAQSSDRAAFCLCDGTSGDKSFHRLTTRRLAQDFASEYIEACLVESSEVPAHQRAVERMIRKWNQHLHSWWAQLDRMQQAQSRAALSELPDGRRVQQFSFVMICGELDLTSRTLVIAQAGDCFGWVFTDSRKFCLPPVPRRIHFQVVCSGEDSPILRTTATIGNVTLRHFDKVCGLVVGTDGVGSFTDLNSNVATATASLEELVGSLRSVRVRTCDDRGLVTAVFRPVESVDFEKDGIAHETNWMQVRP